tara:strand:+ start:81 stop:944 length:864 start_codon:yes stop_codon:yes gene_type:complete
MVKKTKNKEIAIIDITSESTLEEAMKFYVKTLPDDQRMRERAIISDFSKNIGQLKKLSLLKPPEVGDYSQILTSRMANTDTQERLAIVKLFLTYLHEHELINPDLNIPSHLRSKRIITTRKTKSSIKTFEEGPKLTRTRHKTLLSQLEKLNKQKMSLATDIQNAAADGDVRENAPLEAAREAQGMVMSKITDIENLMRGAIIVDDNSQSQIKGKINIGSKVSIENQATKTVLNFQLVDYHEADPLSGKISSESPVGKVILGKSKNEIVSVKSPSGLIDYKILTNSAS